MVGSQWLEPTRLSVRRGYGSEFCWQWVMVRVITPLAWCISLSSATVGHLSLQHAWDYLLHLLKASVNVERIVLKSLPSRWCDLLSRRRPRLSHKLVSVHLSQR